MRKRYIAAPRDAYQRRLFRVSGRVKSADPLQMFFYLLMRRHLPFGVVADLVEETVAEYLADLTYTNGWEARYSKHLAQRVRGLRRARR